MSAQLPWCCHVSNVFGSFPACMSNMNQVSWTLLSWHMWLARCCQLSKCQDIWFKTLLTFQKGLRILFAFCIHLEYIFISHLVETYLCHINILLCHHCPHAHIFVVRNISLCHHCPHGIRRSKHHLQNQTHKSRHKGMHCYQWRGNKVLSQNSGPWSIWSASLMASATSAVYNVFTLHPSKSGWSQGICKCVCHGIWYIIGICLASNMAVSWFAHITVHSRHNMIYMYAWAKYAILLCWYADVLFSVLTYFLVHF